MNIKKPPYRKTTAFTRLSYAACLENTSGAEPDMKKGRSTAVPLPQFSSALIS